MPKYPPPNTRWIPGFVGLYALDVEGTVWTCYYAFPRPRSCWWDKGHKSLTLFRNKRPQSFRVGWLLLDVYGPRRKPGQVPIYKDGNTRNCTLANLRWGRDAERHREHARKGTRGRLAPADVRRIYRSKKSTLALAAEYHVSDRLIRAIRAGTRWGYVTQRKRKLA